MCLAAQAVSVHAEHPFATTRRAFISRALIAAPGLVGWGASPSRSVSAPALDIYQPSLRYSIDGRCNITSEPYSVPNHSYP